MFQGILILHCIDLFSSYLHFSKTYGFVTLSHCKPKSTSKVEEGEPKKTIIQTHQEHYFLNSLFCVQIVCK